MIDDGQEALDKAMLHILQGHGGLTELVGTQIYSDQAPDDVTVPYVIFSHIAGGFDTSSPRPGIDVLFDVTCVGANKTTVLRGAAYIYKALHNQKLAMEGWNNYWLMCQGWLTPPVENVKGKQYWRRGYEVEIRADRR